MEGCDFTVLFLKLLVGRFISKTFTLSEARGRSKGRLDERAANNQGLHQASSTLLLRSSPGLPQTFKLQASKSNTPILIGPLPYPKKSCFLAIFFLHNLTVTPKAEDDPLPEGDRHDKSCHVWRRPSFRQYRTRLCEWSAHSHLPHACKTRALRPLLVPPASLRAYVPSHRSLSRLCLHKHLD